MEYLERIANPTAPPLDLDAIDKKKTEFMMEEGDMKELRMSIKEMEDAFRNPGHLSSWNPQLLGEIDRCFVNNYVGDDGEPVPSLFFPDSPDNMNRFMKYCSDVDLALRTSSETAPRYAREYFMFYSIWQNRPWGFPMPLGTASVVGILHKMTKAVESGFSEVSPRVHGRFVSIDRTRAGRESVPCARSERSYMDRR